MELSEKNRKVDHSVEGFSEENNSSARESGNRYFVVRREWGGHRQLHVDDATVLIVDDKWKNTPQHAYLYTSLFTENLFAHDKVPLPDSYFSRSLLLNVTCPYVSRGQELAISGECEELGGWDLQESKTLSCVGDGEWSILLDADKLPSTSSYKFVIVDKRSRKAVQWEDGCNRSLSKENLLSFAGDVSIDAGDVSMDAGDVSMDTGGVSIDAGDVSIDAGKRTIKRSKKVGGCFVHVEMGLLFHYQHFSYKGKGTSIPLFSLRCDDDFGVGDFAGLYSMVDWAELAGQQIIQLLPLNDTTTTKTWRDSYPYSAISIYALHPIYLGCSRIPLEDREKQEKFLAEAKMLNGLPNLDYEAVLELKDRYGRELFLQEGEEIGASEEYVEFARDNESWLFPYACFCFLRDNKQKADFRDWGEHALYDEARLRRMVESSREMKTEFDYCYFLQFILHKQLSDLKVYAHEKGVSLKGDIPIGISRNSVDAWVTPHLFNMECQAGAPPDDFSDFGQNWGFPTYNWQAMEQEGYDWWKKRFRKMADYFDTYRIDHILGFFRIWEIPLEAVQGLLGRFNPALPYQKDEILRNGFPFDEERMVAPFIHESYLPSIFEEYTEEVKSNYLDITGWQRFQLKSFCNTQRKIEQLFAGQDDEKSARLRDGLYYLCSEVLFVRDREDSSRFHPRIAARKTYSYHHLDESAKNAFNQLHDDFYYERHNDYWRNNAMDKLPHLISSTSMMVCGEDLGMVPSSVPSVMDELQVLSLEIQRMSKDPKSMFTDLNTLPYMSVCTTSTHDMSPLRLWWIEDRHRVQRYYNEILNRAGEAPRDCDGELCKQIIEDHLSSSAMWVILPWQDWLSLDEQLRNPDPDSERINNPSNPEHYWKYRMHISIDKLLKETAFNKKLKDMAR